MTALTTVGFNTIPIGELRSFSLFILLILMIIGASPSGTGGGIKSTTLSGILGTLFSVFSFKKEYINYMAPYIPVVKEVDRKSVKKRKWLNIFKSGKQLEKESNETETTSLEAQKSEDELRKVLGEIFKIKLLGRTIPFDRVIHAIATFSFYFIILFIGVLFLLLVEPFSFEEVFFEVASGLGTVGLSTGITGNLTIFGKTVIIILMFIGRLGPITFGVFLFSRKPKEKPDNVHEDLVI